MADEKVIGVKPTVTKEKKYTTEVYQDIFILVSDETGETQIAIRNNIIWREKFATVQEAKDFIDTKPWGLIVNTVLFIADDVINNKSIK